MNFRYKFGEFKCLLCKWGIQYKMRHKYLFSGRHQRVGSRKRCCCCSTVCFLIFFQLFFKKQILFSQKTSQISVDLIDVVFTAILFSSFPWWSLDQRSHKRGTDWKTSRKSKNDSLGRSERSLNMSNSWLQTTASLFVKELLIFST